jgi:hypothetical protein
MSLTRISKKSELPGIRPSTPNPFSVGFARPVFGLWEIGEDLRLSLDAGIPTKAS